MQRLTGGSKMLRKSELEKRILQLEKQAEAIGLSIQSFTVNDKGVIRELEKCDIGFLHRKVKPAFVSVKNYRHKRCCKEFGEDEYGRMYGIKFLKDSK